MNSIIIYICNIFIYISKTLTVTFLRSRNVPFYGKQVSLRRRRCIAYIFIYITYILYILYLSYPIHVSSFIALIGVSRKLEPESRYIVIYPTAT